VVRDADVAQQRVHGRIATEKRMQPGLEDIPVAIAPGREFSTEDAAFLEDECGAAGVGQVLRCGEPGGAAADDDCVEGCGCEQATDLAWPGGSGCLAASGPHE
jgi:hypothetical protein